MPGMETLATITGYHRRRHDGLCLGQVCDSASAAARAETVPAMPLLIRARAHLVESVKRAIVQPSCDIGANFGSTRRQCQY